jgi:hypothetical protein
MIDKVLRSRKRLVGTVPRCLSSEHLALMVALTSSRLDLADQAMRLCKPAAKR